jgi:cysteinyl-tRNA synthetase
MSAHWHSPIDLSEETLAAAKAHTETFRNAFVEAGRGEGDWEQLARVLDDDFNTADALAVLHGWRAAGALDSMRRGLELFGLGSLAERAEIPPEIVQLAMQREQKRLEGDFEAADAVRHQVDELGWEIRDGTQGFQLVPKR